MAEDVSRVIGCIPVLVPTTRNPEHLSILDSCNYRVRRKQRDYVTSARAIE
jgi:hypothetical protein